MRKLRLIPVLLLSLFVPLTLVACGDDDDDDLTGSGGVTGTYTLRTVNGQSLPFVEYEDSEWKDEITAGSITLSSAGACTVSISVRETYKPDNEVESGTFSEQCTYTISGSTLTVNVGGDVDVATISGNTITYTDDGEIWIYRK